MNVPLQHREQSFVVRPKGGCQNSTEFDRMPCSALKSKHRHPGIASDGNQIDIPEAAPWQANSTAEGLSQGETWSWRVNGSRNMSIARF